MKSYGIKKIEVIFEQVEKEIKSKNLKVSLELCLQLLEVLRNKPKVSDDKEIEESVNKPVEIPKIFEEIF